MKIIREKAGVISKEKVWICFDSYYMYIHENLFELLWIILTEFKNDKHIVG